MVAAREAVTLDPTAERAQTNTEHGAAANIVAPFQI